MRAIISQMAVLIIIISIGYISGKAKLLTPDGSRLLSKLVIHVTTPCIMLSSVLSGDLAITAGETAFFLLMTVPVYIVAFIVAIPASRILCGKKTDCGMYLYMIVFSNVTFMGFPVAYAIFGPVSAFFISLFTITFMLLNFSIGIFLVSGNDEKFSPKTLINTSFITALICIPIAIAGLGAPAVITDSVRILGSMTTPCAMLVIGASLSQIPIKNVFSDWRLYPMALLKMVVLPVLTWLALRHLVSNELMLGMLVVLSGMPVALAATMFAFEYGGNERMASSGIFLTTILSLATIPLIVFFLLT